MLAICIQMFLISLNCQNLPPTYLLDFKLDYSIWGVLQQLVYQLKFKNIDHLKQILNSCWDTITQKLINGSIDQWSKRPFLVIHSYDGHNKHRFD